MKDLKSIPEAQEVQEQVDPRENGPQAPKRKLVAYETSFVDGLYQYLNTKPHMEVRGLIDKLAEGQGVEV